MKLSLIVAIGKNNEIGRKNNLLWDMPADMKHFRETTKGHMVIMGRKTFESIGKPLPNRRNIIVTKDKNYKVVGAEIVHSLEEFLKQIKNLNEEVFIIGGGELYRKTIQMADKLYVTRVDAEDKDADAFFPKIDKNRFKETKKEAHEGDEKNNFDYTFLEYDRRS